MSARAAFINALFDDDELNSLGLDENTIFHNYTSEERPADTGPFVIIRYGAQPRPAFRDVKSPEQLRVWVHYPLQVTNDYEKIIVILDRIDMVVKEIRDQPAHNGYVLGFVDIGGRSDDLIDGGFGTITKWSEYQLHSQKS